MKIAFVSFLALLLFACSKNKRIINTLAGKWQFYDVLHYDGSHSYPNETLVFEKGEADGKSFLPLTVYSSDTINGSYLVSKKGDYVYFQKNNQNIKYPAEKLSCRKRIHSGDTLSKSGPDKNR